MGLAETVKESPPKPSCRASPQSKILLVDDEQDILDILARALGIAGYNVDAACNGQLALDKVSAQDYDLIVTNIRMPVMGGEAFYRELCSSYPRLAKRVIFCTGDIANLATQRFLNTTGAPAPVTVSSWGVALAGMALSDTFHLPFASALVVNF